MIEVSNYVFVDKIMYSGIPLIQHPWGWTGAILSDIPDYQTGRVLTSVRHHHHVQEGLGLIPVPCILKMKLVPPSLPRSSYVSSSFWFIL